MKVFAPLLFIILIFLLSVFFSFPTESYIEKQIREANYCHIDSDCFYLEGKCPFGCHIYVNKKEASKIEKLLDSFQSGCIYGCVEKCSFVECDDGKCISLCQ
jgi:hypothetical protein